MSVWGSTRGPHRIWHPFPSAGSQRPTSLSASRVASCYWHDQATADCTHVSADAGRGWRIVAAFVPHPASASPRRMTIIAMAAMWGRLQRHAGPQAAPTILLYAVWSVARERNRARALLVSRAPVRGGVATCRLRHQEAWAGLSRRGPRTCRSSTRNGRDWGIDGGRRRASGFLLTVWRRNAPECCRPT